VPVYLGDSLRWGEDANLLSYAGLSVSTRDDYEIFVDQIDYGERLSFPDRVLDNFDAFERLVTELANRATKRSRGSAVPTTAAAL
jgi:hypothetical protein